MLHEARIQSFLGILDNKEVTVVSRSQSNSAIQWTAEEIEKHLGISTAVYQKMRLGARQIAEIRQAGIKRIEISSIPHSFDYRDYSQVTEVMEECVKQGVEIVGVHGWTKLSPQTEDAEEWRFMIDESLSAIRFAEEVGASIYVAHFGCTEGSKRLVAELLDRTDGFRVSLTTENGRNLRPFMAAVDDIGSERFGITVDIGHTRDSDGINPFVKKDRARQTLSQCGDRVFHVHLHEIFDQEQKPDHHPPLHNSGIVEWGEVFAALRDIGYRGELIFEDGRGENPEEWVKMTGTFPRIFVQRYA
jgi:sugar phosphate isomerase/epimerase